MLRNLLLALSTLGLLVVLFVAYTRFADRPTVRAEPNEPLDELPAQADANTPAIAAGDDASIPGGGKFMFRVFDERTGRPTDLIRGEDWQPVPGSKNEIRITGPELVKLMPSGMVVTVWADRGQLTGDRIERSQFEPRDGYLEGNVRIVVDRETAEERTPREERPWDLITIELDRLQFDLERGQLETDGPVRVAAQEFEIAGTGLDLVWNQADNRVETLTIAQGEEFVFYTPAGLLDSMMGGQPQQAATEPPVPETPPAAPKRARRTRQATAYACTLRGDVVAEQYQANEAGESQQIGALRAAQVDLLFDVGAGAGRFLRKTTTTQPTTRPVRDPRNRLVVRWSGPLHLEPQPTAEADASRLHFVAHGAPVVLTRHEASVHCRKVEYHDETQRLWLDPLPDEPVRFAVGNNLSARAAGVYVDRQARIVKLVGDVLLRSRRGGPNELSAIRCAHWAELHLAESAPTTQPVDPAGDSVLTMQRLESATFVGDVIVDLAEQQMTAHQLDIAFHPDQDNRPLEELLDVATASGGVRMASGDVTLDAARLEIAFGLSPARDVYPQRMHALGAVAITRGTAKPDVLTAAMRSLTGVQRAEPARIRGDEVIATMAPLPADPATTQPTVAAQTPREQRANFVIRSLEVLGDASLRDPQNRVAARGQRIGALFTGDNALRAAVVQGDGQERGRVYRAPYLVEGAQIDLSRPDQSIVVNGPSRLAMKTRRSLQGARRSDPTTVTVESQQLLRVDGQDNRVRFEGNVVATSRAEQLRADTLTLTLEDVPEPTGDEPPPGFNAWRPWWQLARALGDAYERDTDAGGLRLTMGDATQPVRKEPRFLIATNALVTSETYDGDGVLPLMHASLSAPTLEGDIANRQIVTHGLTQLLMTDRRGIRDVAPVERTFGVPSALVSRGPSQTAMQCEGRMTYTLGAPGPDRMDTVVFEDDVLFVHRTGSEMVNVEMMLPSDGTAKVDLDRYQSRSVRMECRRLECWFKADDSGPRPVRSGGLTGYPMQLNSLLAKGNVYLRDREGSQIRQVSASLVEFDRAASRLDVQGTDTAVARIYFEDSETGQFDIHAGDQLVVNLRDGTIRTGAMTGELHRP